MTGLERFTLEYELKMLEKESYNGKIKAVIKKFITELKIKENISEVRRQNYVQRLRVVARWIPEKFLKPDKDAIDIVLEKLSDSGYSDWTRETYINMIKKFYKWYLGGNKLYPDFLDGVKKPKHHETVKSEELVTQEEVNSLINSSKNPRDRALFSLLYISGARIGELLGMRIGDVAFDDYGALLRVNAEKYRKTGYRQIRIIGNSIAYLKAWLDYHPDRLNRAAWLFCGVSEGTSGEQLAKSDVYSIIRKTKKRAGITKKIYPHLFRHTRATILASKVAEAPLESQMGWVHGSRQTRTYVHLSLRDQDNAILKAYGIKVDEDKTIKEEQPKECQRCHELNPSDASYCRKCWLPFTQEQAIEFQEKENELTSFLENSKVLDPNLVNMLKEAKPEERTIVLNLLSKVTEGQARTVAALKQEYAEKRIGKESKERT